MEKLEAAWQIGPNAKASRLRVVKQFLTAAGNKDAAMWEIRAQPHPKMDRVFLSEEAVQDLRKIAHSMGPEIELIFSLGVDNSLRAGDQARITFEEAKALLWKDQAVITCKGRGGGKRRLMVMHRATREPLKAYLKLREDLVTKHGSDPGNLLVTDHTGQLENMNSDGVQWRVEKLSAQAGVYFRSHDQRATFGNRHWKRGTDLLTIAALMGHETPNTTFRSYIGVNQGDMRDAQDLLGEGGR